MIHSSVGIIYMMGIFGLVGWLLYALERHRVKELRVEVQRLSAIVKDMQRAQHESESQIFQLSKKINTQADEHATMLRIITKVDKLFNLDDDEKDTTKGV